MRPHPVVTLPCAVRVARFGRLRRTINAADDVSERSALGLDLAGFTM